MNNLAITYKATADLLPYINNAKKHSADQVAMLAASIKEFGFNNPILTDGDNGVIAGHGRLQAAQKLGLKTVPTIGRKSAPEPLKNITIKIPITLIDYLGTRTSNKSAYVANLLRIDQQAFFSSTINEETKDETHD
jgi:ParB-like chromosome segregation protein Spo0J